MESLKFPLNHLSLLKHELIKSRKRKEKNSLSLVSNQASSDWAWALVYKWNDWKKNLCKRWCVTNQIDVINLELSLSRKVLNEVFIVQPLKCTRLNLIFSYRHLLFSALDACLCCWRTYNESKIPLDKYLNLILWSLVKFFWIFLSIT
jgi:hypothetical protein